MADVRKITPTEHGNEVDFLELIKLFWDGKWTIIVCTVLTSVIAVGVALWLPNVYRSEVLLAPVTSDQKNDLAAMASQFGGLASLAGLKMPDNSGDKITLGIETLKSRKFITQFIRDHDILVPLMASSRWNPKTRELKLDGDLYDSKAGKWVRDVEPPQLPQPSLLEGYEKFIDIFSLSQDQTTGYVTIAIEHHSPELARRWVEWLVQDINSAIKNHDVVVANHALEFLNDQIKRTSLSGLQNMLFGLVEEQTKTIMLANISPEYVFRTVDPAVVPDKESKPKRLLICIIGAFLGGVLGGVILIIRNSVGPAVEKES